MSELCGLVLLEETAKNPDFPAAFKSTYWAAIPFPWLSDERLEALCLFGDESLPLISPFSG